MRICGAFLIFAAFACGDQGNGIQNPKRDSYRSWIEIDPDGLVCGNNSPYRFWVNYSDKSDNLAVVFEPGGACWDYPGCTGADGDLGAANIDGLKPDHYSMAGFISPFLNPDDDTTPSRDWNWVYVPYCTGDVHTGNVVATYTDTASSATVEFHHEGHANVVDVTSWIDSNFTHIPKMLVTGCSAGGVGALVNYHILRNGIHAAKKSYLLDDSGPIFPDAPGGFSTPLHQKIRQAWNIDSLLPQFPPGFSLDDMGTLNTTLADEFPDDRIAITFFERDYGFSRYSYEPFYTNHDKTAVMQMWAADTALLTNLYQTRDNLHYFLPYWRNINMSHCTTLLSFAGSDIEDHNMTLQQWISDFVNDRPIQSMQEAPVPGEDP
jgi:hypothetical protein